MKIEVDIELTDHSSLQSTIEGAVQKLTDDLLAERSSKAELAYGRSR